VRQNGDGSSTAFLTNTVVAGQAVGVQVVAGTATLDGVLWGNGAWANDANTNGAIDVSNAVTGTPAFVDPAAGDYHIGAGSAARDAAITTNPPVGDDIDGQPRPQGSQPDLGADEYWPPPCATLSAVGLAGPITGTAGTGLPFTATVSPPTATLPITYTWQATGQTPVTQTIPVTQSDVVFAWPLSGTQAITVAAINCSDWLTATRLITVETLPGQACTPLSDVGLGGPSTGITGTVYLFTATANPPTATLPITFSWQTAGLSPLTQTVPVTRTIAAFIWGITGTQAITLAAANCGSAVSTTGVITIEGESGPVVIPGHGVYLPMISCPAQ
jgi:hypothetical protein